RCRREDQIHQLDGERAGRGRDKERRELTGQTELVQGMAVEAEQDQPASADQDDEVADPRRVVARCLAEERGQQSVATERKVPWSMAALPRPTEMAYAITQ